MKGKLGESYNVGSSRDLKNIDLAKKVIKIFKKNPSNKRRNLKLNM